ncbi:MAG TPA: 5'/3'-nucleotidase SurE [Dehalococcoidia bacterium]|nr:5'/3'-nucleotidase SurE [Dehalococcoidia bacterium]
MKILLTNDDGIRATGLWAAVEALRKVGEVFVVAPDREQSGVGASLTLHSSLRVTPEQVPDSVTGPTNGDPTGNENGVFPVTAYSVQGTPGDSCILALENVVGAVDLVVSGINSGSNLGWDVMVSGTFGAALQGYVRGYPTIAISVGAVNNPQFSAASQLLEMMALRFRDNAQDFNSSLFLNINIPSLPVERISGLKVTQLGSRSYGESVRVEGTGDDKRYWIARNRPISGTPVDGTDIWAMKNNYISITPMQISFSQQQQAADVEKLVDGISDELLKPSAD